MTGKLLITTSREPSKRVRSFVKDLSIVLPHSVRVSRGKATYSELATKATSLGAYGVLIVLERRGNPSSILYAEPRGTELEVMFLLKLGGVTLMRELPGSQRPLGLGELILVPSSVPKGFPEIVSSYLLQALRPKIVESPGGRAVELKILGGEDGALITFICVTSDRECGPRFRVVKVIDYAKRLTSSQP